MKDYKELTVKTPCGEMRGLIGRGKVAFRGIRYATAERFEKPRLITEWEGVYDATEFGDCCPQYRAYHDESALSNTLYYDEFRRGLDFTYGEDCLNLNVYAPSEGKDLPVIIFVHGGNFAKGSSSEWPFFSTDLPDNGVILVTINYRLNVFGFYAGDGAQGNLGLYDIMAAVDWVKSNVSAFGGDASNITLAGQSAGAMSVQQLILSGKLGDAVKRAVLLSGGGVLPTGFMLRKKKGVKKYWNTVAKAAGANDFAALKTMPAKDLYEAWRASNPIRQLLCTTPIIDNELISAPTVVTAKEGGKIPCIIGMVTADIVPALLRKGMFKYAKTQYKLFNTQNYLYDFTQLQSPNNEKPWHSADLFYWLGTIKNCHRKVTDGDIALATETCVRLAEFARSGSPNTIEYGGWKAYPESKTPYQLSQK